MSLLLLFPDTLIIEDIVGISLLPLYKTIINADF